jgi:hypothetical protein
MQAYNEGFNGYSGNLQKRVETQIFNIIVLKGKHFVAISAFLNELFMWYSVVLPC